MTDDPREAAARYRLEQEARARGRSRRPSAEESAHPAPGLRGAGGLCWRSRSSRRSAAATSTICPARAGPCRISAAPHDPDWWIRRKIEREQLRGLGPPAIMLRVEHAELDERLDELVREAEVRETLEDFNRRVIEARRQLLGGPPRRDADAGRGSGGRGLASPPGGARRRGGTGTLPAAAEAERTTRRRRRRFRHSAPPTT